MALLSRERCTKRIGSMNDNGQYKKLYTLMNRRAPERICKLSHCMVIDEWLVNQNKRAIYCSQENSAPVEELIEMRLIDSSKVPLHSVSNFYQNKSNCPVFQIIVLFQQFRGAQALQALRVAREKLTRYTRHYHFSVSLHNPLSSSLTPPVVRKRTTRGKLHAKPL